MCAKVKKPVLRTIGLVAFVLGLIFESVLHPSTTSGHFAGGFLLGFAVVLLIAGSNRLHRARTRYS